MANSVTRQRTINKSVLEYAKINRNKSWFNDITITAGNESIPANRLILSCYSIYFEKLFKSNMREQYEHVIKIQTIDGQSLKTLIDYIYSGSIVINTQNVMSLLSGADYLQLDDVKQFCFEFLQVTITPNTSLRILEAASLYKNSDLKNEVQRYNSDHLYEVAQSDDFKSYSKPQIMECISNLDHNKARSTSVYQAIITWIYHKKSRKIVFPELFKMVNLNNLDLEFLEETVLEEKLVETNFNCQKLVLKAYRTLLSQQNINANESKLLSVGGANTRSKVAIVYNLINERCKPDYPDLIQGLRYHSSIKLEDYLYVIGGQIDSCDASNVWRLNLKNQTSKWEQVSSMNKKRSVMGAAVYKNTIVVCGGSETNLTAAEAYLATFNEWKTLSPMKQGRYGHSVAVCEEFVYALGGRSTFDNILSSAEKLEKLTGDWKHVKAMQIPRSNFAAVYCNDTTYAIGGRSDDDDWKTAKTVEKYVPASNQWSYVNSMNFARIFHASSVLRGKIYVVGGVDPARNAVTAIECYDPKNATWSIVEETTDEWFEHTLVTV